MIVFVFVLPIDPVESVIAQVEVGNVPHAGEGESGQSSDRIVL